MKAVRIHEFGGPEVLELDEIAIHCPFGRRGIDQGLRQQREPCGPKDICRRSAGKISNEIPVNHWLGRIWRY